MPRVRWKEKLLTAIVALRKEALVTWAVTAAGFVYAVIALPPEYRGWAWAGLGVVVLAALVKIAAHVIHRKVSSKPLQVIRHATTAQLEEAERLGERRYEDAERLDAYPPREVMEQWYHRYPGGGFLLVDEHEHLWGYVSMWPVTEAAFHGLKEGKKREKDLKGLDIQMNGTGPFHYWYIADVCREDGVTKIVSGYLLSYMIAEVIRQLAEKDLQDWVEILAIAETEAGTNLVHNEMFGFHPVRKSSKIFVATVKRSEAEQVAEHLLKSIAPLEARVRKVLAKRWEHRHVLEDTPVRTKPRRGR